MTTDATSPVAVPTNGYFSSFLSSHPVLADVSPSSSTATATSDPSFPTGTIAALALAGILVFIILASCLYYFMIYRPRIRHRDILSRAQYMSRRRPSESKPMDFQRQMNSNAFGEIGDSSSSKRRGFERWRRDVESGFRFSYLSNFGLAFRHSSDERRQSEDDYADDAPLSSKSDTTSSSTKARRTAAKGKGRAMPTSWIRSSKTSASRTSRTQSYTLDLPRPSSRQTQSEESADMDEESPRFAPIHLMPPAPPHTAPVIQYPPSRYSSPHPYSSAESTSIRNLQPLIIPDLSLQSPTEPSTTTPVPRHGRQPSSKPLLHRGDSVDDSPVEGAYARPPIHYRTPEGSNDTGSIGDTDLRGDLNALKTAQVALRSLSPRTSEVVPRASVYKSGPKERTSAAGWPPGYPAPASNPLFPPIQSRHSGLPIYDDGPTPDCKPPITPTADPIEGPSRSKRNSGFSVRFQEDATDTHPSSAVKGKGKAVGEPVDDRPQKAATLTVALPRAPLRTAASRHNTTSFLDFGGSSDGSTRTPSNNGDSSSSNIDPSIFTSGDPSRWSVTSSHVTGMTNPLQSRWSTTTQATQATQATHSTQDYGRLLPSTLMGADPEDNSSGASYSGLTNISSRTNPFPYPLSLPASPHHPAHILEMQQAQAAERARQLQIDTSGDDNPLSQATDLISPTESVPMTVSEIHFRHSMSEDVYGMQRNSSGSHLPPHPPLPSVSDEDHQGSRLRTESNVTQDSTSTSFIIQRVLGHATALPVGSPLTQISIPRAGDSSSPSLTQHDPLPTSPTTPRP